MNNKNKQQITSVFYHANCLDGYGAAWAAWKSLGDKAHYQEVQHQTPMPDFSAGSVLYILDFCYPIEQLINAAQTADKIIVLDHHISAQRALEAYQGVIPTNVRIHFNMQQSGCIMAWHYFQGDTIAPILLKHIEDHDLWRHQMAHTKEIVQALFLRRHLSLATFEQLSLDDLYREGKILLKQHRQMVKVLLNCSHSIKLGDTLGLAANAPGAFTSELGQALAKQSGTFGLTYHYHGESKEYRCGLRSIGEFDVSKLAVSFGGGGHRNAAGFSRGRDAFLALF